MPVQWGTNPAVSQSVFLLRDVLAARPAAVPANQDYYFLARDENGGTLYQSTGSAWVQVAGAVNDPDVTTFAGLTDVDMTGVTDGQVPALNVGAGKYEPVSLPPAPTTGYAFASQNTGVVATSGVSTPLPFDTVGAATTEFTVAPGDSAITINQPGVYLAWMDCYPTSGVWTTGLLGGGINSGSIVFASAVSAEGAVAANSGAVQLALLIVATTTTVSIAASQNSGSDQTISGDLMLIRLGLPTA